MLGDYIWEGVKSGGWRMTFYEYVHEAMKTLSKIIPTELEELKRKNIPPPRRIIAIPSEHEPFGFYDHKVEVCVITIGYMPTRIISPIHSLLHEIAHHKQYYEAGKNPKKAWGDRGRWAKKRSEWSADMYAYRRFLKHGDVYKELVEEFKKYMEGEYDP